MVFLFLVSILGVTFFAPNPTHKEYLNHEKPIVSASYNKRWGKNVDETITGLEYSPGKTYSRYKLVPKFAIHQTVYGSTFIAAGFKKDIVLSSRFLLTGHAMPAISFIRNEDEDFSSGHLNFNLGFGISYLVTKQFSVELGLLHISNANTRRPNEGIDALNFKINFHL
jgi:hypothetical protein